MMLDTIKQRLKNDKNIKLLALLSLISVFIQIIIVMTYINPIFPLVQNLKGLLYPLLYLLPDIGFLFFILFQYKTEKKLLFTLTFILQCSLTILNLLSNIIFIVKESIEFTYILEILLRSLITPEFLFSVCMIIFSIRGLKNINIAKVICILQLAFVAIQGIISLANGFVALFANISFSATTSLFISLLRITSQILFYIVVTKAMPTVFTLGKTEEQN